MACKGDVQKRVPGIAAATCRSRKGVGVFLNINSLQIEHAEAAAAAAASQAAASSPPAPRFAGAMDWCEGLDALLAALGGVRLEAVARDELRLRISVHAEATWEPTPSELGA